MDMILNENDFNNIMRAAVLKALDSTTGPFKSPNYHKAFINVLEEESPWHNETWDVIERIIVVVK